MKDSTGFKSSKSNWGIKGGQNKLSMPSSASNRIQNKSLNRNFMPLRDQGKLIIDR